jgi:phosphoribosylanthranilate isomerase
MARIKICGITNLEDARLAADLGAHALGFIFYPKSPRSVRPDAARDIIRALPPFVLTVGVFVDEDAGVVRDMAETGRAWTGCRCTAAKAPDYCKSLGRRVIKGFRVRGEEIFDGVGEYKGAVQAFLLDAYKPGHPGGTGETFDWEIARRAATCGPIILAGGLTANNIAEAIRVAQPAAVDVASGVEAAPGRKDPVQLREFFRALGEQ